jgi:hypothetical protein
MMTMEQLERLNRGERVVTYEMTVVKPGRLPVVGEYRYLAPCVQSPSDPGSMIPLRPQRVIWTGKSWVLA